MKIQIKTAFWNKPLEEQREKLMDIVFWGNVFFMANIGYFIFKGGTLMLITNLLIFALYMLIIISYNKRNKEDDRKESN